MKKFKHSKQTFESISTFGVVAGGGDGGRSIRIIGFFFSLANPIVEIVTFYFGLKKNLKSREF